MCNLKFENMKTIEFRYRDATNYKTFFSVDVDEKKYPEAKKVKTGDEITMGELGTPNEDEFFESEIHPMEYDHETDHNILEIIEIN